MIQSKMLHMFLFYYLERASKFGKFIHYEEHNHVTNVILLQKISKYCTLQRIMFEV